MSVGSDYYCTTDVDLYLGDSVVLQYGFNAAHPEGFGVTTYTSPMPAGWNILTDSCSGNSAPPPTGNTLHCVVDAEFNATTLGPSTLEYQVIETVGSNGVQNYYVTLNTFVHEPCAKCDVKEAGSIIGVTKQTLSERIPIVGTDFFLNYSSDYTSSYATDHTGIGTIPEFNRHLWTISPQHHFQISNMKLFKGDGESQVMRQIRGVTFVPPLITQHESVSPDGKEIYFFDTFSGRHLSTKSALTGVLKYQFTYSGDKLIYIDDTFGNRTTLNYNGSGNLISIVAPYGQTTTVAVSGTGRILSVTNPNGEIYSLTYKTGTKLLETFTKPGGQISTFSYDSNGRLIQDLSFGGNKWELSKTGTDKSGSVSQESNLGTETNHYITHSGGTLYRNSVEPDGFSTNYVEESDGDISIANVIESRFNSVARDERFFGQLKRISSETHTIGSNIKSTTYGQSVTTGIIDPRFAPWLQYFTETNTRTVNSKTWTNFFDKATRTFTDTSPEGAIVTTELNANEQLASLQVGSDTPWD
ncbi:MAG: hypothetical protein K2Q26_01805 [Bdellovibrionales bacterium]|nr:hypothetical protein [Bdellovibrionales bacterium]